MILATVTFLNQLLKNHNLYILPLIYNYMENHKKYLGTRTFFEGSVKVREYEVSQEEANRLLDIASKIGGKVTIKNSGWDKAIEDSRRRACINAVEDWLYDNEIESVSQARYEGNLKCSVLVWLDKSRTKLAELLIKVKLIPVPEVEWVATRNVEEVPTVA